MAEEEQVVKEVEEAEAKVAKEPFSWKRLLTTVAIVIVTAGVVFGVTWYILDKMTREDQEASDKLRVTLQNQIDELRGKLKTGTTATTTTATVVDTQKYTNSEFGFQLTFPADWKGYKLLEKQVEGTTKTWYAELPTTDPVWATATSTSDAGYVSLFAISAFTDAQWTEMMNAGGQTDTEIVKIGNYTFGYSGAQAGATDIEAAKSAAIKSIIATFKAS